MKIDRDLCHWLCEDCMVVAVNGDYTGLDYTYDHETAEYVAKQIDRGLAALPGLVPNFGGEDPEHYECRDCGYIGDWESFPFYDVPDSCRICPTCGEDWIKPVPFDNGEEEFSRRDCDCCGITLAGARFRFAQLIREDAEASLT